VLRVSAESLSNIILRRTEHAPKIPGQEFAQPVRRRCGDGLHDKASAAVQLSTSLTNEKLKNSAYVCGSWWYSQTNYVAVILQVAVVDGPN
jgi:hypothetical protein